MTPIKKIASINDLQEGDTISHDDNKNLSVTSNYNKITNEFIGNFRTAKIIHTTTRDVINFKIYSTDEEIEEYKSKFKNLQQTN